MVFKKDFVCIKWDVSMSKSLKTLVNFFSFFTLKSIWLMLLTFKIKRSLTTESTNNAI